MLRVGALDGEGLVMAKYTVSFKLEDLPGADGWESAEVLERELGDILRRVVAPTFDAVMVPLSFTVRKARG